MVVVCCVLLCVCHFCEIGRRYGAVNVCECAATSVFRAQPTYMHLVAPNDVVEKNATAQCRIVIVVCVWCAFDLSWLVSCVCLLVCLFVGWLVCWLIVDCLNVWLCPCLFG